MSLSVLTCPHAGRSRGLSTGPRSRPICISHVSWPQFLLLIVPIHLIAIRSEYKQGKIASDRSKHSRPLAYHVASANKHFCPISADKHTHTKYADQNPLIEQDRSQFHTACVSLNFVLHLLSLDMFSCAFSRAHYIHVCVGPFDCLMSSMSSMCTSLSTDAIFLPYAAD